ncbi:MAG: hypothetical protein R2684_08165 [Pyrinomonadaceae bacterium]
MPSIKAEINLHYDLRVPENLSSPAPLLIAVHGYGAHMGYMMRESKLITPDSWVIASLQGPNKFWQKTEDGKFKPVNGWLTDYEPAESVALHHDFVNKIIDKLKDESLVDPERAYLFGFSQACALNFRYAFTFPEKLAGIIGVSGGIPSDLDENPAYGAISGDALYLYGSEDEFYPNEKFNEYDGKLAGFLPNYQSIQYTATHEITQEMRNDMREWLLLRSER